MSQQAMWLPLPPERAPRMLQNALIDALRTVQQAKLRSGQPVKLTTDVQVRHTIL